MSVRKCQSTEPLASCSYCPWPHMCAGPTGGEAQPQAPAQTATASQSPQPARAGVSQEPSEAVPQPVADSLPPASSTQAPPPDGSKQPEMSFRQALAQQEAAKSEEAGPSQAALSLGQPQEPSSTAPAKTSSATRAAGTSEDPSSHAAAVASSGSSVSSRAAATSKPTQRQSSSGRQARRRAWPVVNRRRGQESNGILVDEYSSAVSDSDTSEDEEAHQSAPVLGGISAKSIQSG